LVYTTDDMLREHLAAAIASCAPYGSNTQELGRLKTVTPIVGYMVSDNAKVHRTTAMALQKLSADPQNCITMHAVSILIVIITFFQRFIFRVELYHFFWKLLDQMIRSFKKLPPDV
jgi:hypothetical protein